MCQCHGSRFDIATGGGINGPATEALTVYEVEEVEGTIHVQIWRERRYARREIRRRRARGLPVSFIEGTQSGDERRYPIPAGDSVNIDRTAQLFVARAQGHVYVLARSCPHQNDAVKWLPNDHRFQCTKHDSQYQVDGLHTAGRATRNLDRYVIHRDGDTVVVDLHRWIQSDKDPAGWRPQPSRYSQRPARASVVVAAEAIES
jgi:Rieske Fe-S protein